MPDSLLDATFGLVEIREGSPSSDPAKFRHQQTSIACQVRSGYYQGDEPYVRTCSLMGGEYQELCKSRHQATMTLTVNVFPHDDEAAHIFCAHMVNFMLSHMKTPPIFLRGETQREVQEMRHILDHLLTPDALSIRTTNPAHYHRFLNSQPHYARLTKPISPILADLKNIHFPAIRAVACE